MKQNISKSCLNFLLLLWALPQILQGMYNIHLSQQAEEHRWKHWGSPAFNNHIIMINRFPLHIYIKNSFHRESWLLFCIFPISLLKRITNSRNYIHEVLKQSLEIKLMTLKVRDVEADDFTDLV